MVSCRGSDSRMNLVKIKTIEFMNEQRPKDNFRAWRSNINPQNSYLTHNGAENWRKKYYDREKTDGVRLRGEVVKQTDRPKKQSIQKAEAKAQTREETRSKE